MYLLFQCLHFYENFDHIRNSNEKIRSTRSQGLESGFPSRPQTVYDNSKRCVQVDKKVFMANTTGFGTRNGKEWISLQACKDSLLDSGIDWVKGGGPEWTRIINCSKEKEEC